MSSSKRDLKKSKKSAAIRNIEQAMARLEEVFLKDERVLAAFYCGSCGTGAYDEYSDIDLALVVADEDRKPYFKMVPKILQRAVGLKSAVNEAGEDAEWCCLITDDYIGLDLPIFTEADLIPSHKFASIKILKDHNGLLHRFKRRSASQRPCIDAKKFVNDMQDIKDDQLYMARAVSKGRLLEALGECTRVGEELFHWLVTIKGIQYHPPSLRDAEKFLTKKQLDLLLRTRPKDPAASEIRAAMRAVWELTLHVIDEYESKTGKKLPKWYDHDEYLGLVNDIYDGRRF